MADLWGLGEGVIPYSGNWQVRGTLNPDQQADENAGAHYERLWYGPCAQEPYRAAAIDLEQNESIFARLREVMPEAANIRLPFNINCWGTYGTQYHDPAQIYAPAYELFLEAAARQNYPIHWCLMDGPSQRADDAGDGPAYPTNKTEANLLAWADLLTARQVLSHQTLVNWLANNPAKAPPSWAFEFINEPDIYNRIGRDLGDNMRAYAIYAQHNVNIWQQVYATAQVQFDSAWIFIGGFNYSANFAGLVLPNPHLPNGVSAIQYIRDNIPDSRLAWSMHGYPGWFGGSDRHEFRRRVRARLGGVAPEGLEGDRVMMTETNVRHGVIFAYPWIYAGGYANYLNFKMAQWYSNMGIGICWWAMGNYAQAHLIQITGGLEGVRMEHGWSHGPYHYMASYANNDAYFGPNVDQRGERSLKIDRAIQRWVSVNRITDSEGNVIGTDERKEFEEHGLIGSNAAVLGVGAMARGYGGRGTCVVRGKGGYGNFLYGGDGYNVLFGGTSPCMDFLALGRGGGVIRSTHALMAVIVGSTHSPSRLYLSPNKNYVSLFENTTNPHEVIIDPTSTFSSVIEAFTPNRDGEGNGDRVSFKGAFATPQELKDAMTISVPGHDNPGTQDMREDLVVNLPGGGTVTFSDRFNLIHSLDQYCLDFTDGWYQEGWTEPEDYDPAALDEPAPPADSFDYDPLLFPDESGSDPPPLGGQVSVFDRSGNALTIRDIKGNSIPMSEVA